MLERKPDSPFPTLVDRFVKYAKIHTTSSEESETYPSTERQFDLARILVRKSDQQRGGFIKYYFDRNWEESVHYDLTINTQRLSEDTAVKIICDSIKDHNLEGVKADSKKILSDLILRKRVEIAILSNDYIDPYLLEINVKDGLVVLSGQVHSAAEKQTAEQQARTADGIHDLKNNIKVVEYRTNPDDH